METMLEEFLKRRLSECFHETLEYEIKEYEFNKYYFPPMLFIVDKDLEIIGGPVDGDENIDVLIEVAIEKIPEAARQTGGLLPCAMMVTSGIAVKDDSELDSTRSRLFSIYSDDFSYSKIEFSDFRKPFESSEILDSQVKDILVSIINAIKEANGNV